MRILLITTFYAPDLGPGAALFTMLSEELVTLGHRVSVLAAVPHYPTGTVSSPFRGHLIQREVCNGIDITRVWVPSVNRARLGLRLMTFVIYQLLSTIAGLRRSYDLVLAGNPALEVFLPFLVLAVLRRKPAIFSVHDLYPQVGVKLGVFRHRWVVSLVQALEDFCLRRAACVRVLSEGFRQAIRARGVADSKILLIWDWLDPDFIRPMPRANPFSIHWGLDRSFVVMYAGNMGLSQGLESVLSAAAVLSVQPEIQVVLVGDGAGRTALQERALSSGLTNVRFLPFQRPQTLPLVLASADVSLVCLKRGVSADSVPSKFYSILASGRPVVASVDRESDTYHLVQTARCGLCVEPEDPQALASAILSLHRDKGLCARLGANGREYVVSHHGRAAAAQEFHRAISSLAIQDKRSLKAGRLHG